MSETSDKRPVNVVFNSKSIPTEHKECSSTWTLLFRCITPGVDLNERNTGDEISAILSAILAAALEWSGPDQGTSAVSQDADGFWVVQTSVYTRHFSPSPDHINRQDLLGL